jgi:protein O-mannosyl-transferase
MSIGDRLPPVGASRAAPATAIAISLLIILAGISLAYASSFRGCWSYDDQGAILENPTIRHVIGSWSPPPHSGLPVGGRPLVNLSLAINYAISGTAVWSYHLGNTVIHAVAALLFFGIVRRTAERLGNRFPGSSRATDITYFACAIALVWSVHPLSTEAVTYVAQRAESLMACFYLLTLYGFIRAVETNRIGWYVVSAAACCLGMATKEVMVSAPFAVLLYDRTFVSGGWRAAWRQRRVYYLLLAVSWTILAWLLITNGGRGGTAGFDVSTGVLRYAVAQVHAHLLYLKLAIWPHPLVFDYGTDVVPFAGFGLVAGLVLGVLLLASIYGVWRRSAFGFLGALYFALLIPTSSIMPIATEPIAEHRMYLPLAALLCAGGWTVIRCARRWWLASALLAVALTVLTARRAFDYRSARALWTDTLLKCPTNARAQYNLGQVLLNEGDMDGATLHLTAALAIRPNFPSALHGLSQALLRRGRATEAQQRAEAALQLQPDFAAAHNDLGSALLLNGEVTAALREFQSAVQLSPQNVEFRNNLGAALGRLNRWPEARAQYERALQLRPDLPLLHFGLANTLVRLGDLGAAIAEYEYTVKLDRNYPGAVDHLARVRAMLEPRPHAD